MNLAIHVLAAFGPVWRGPAHLDAALVDGMAEQWNAGRSAATGLALTVALVWGVHPLQTESVTYLIQRTEALMGLFYLLTLYLAIRAMASPQSTGWIVLSIAACALGMASKEVMVSAPLVILVYDRLFVGGRLKELLRRRWPLYAGLAATWLLLGCLLVRVRQPKWHGRLWSPMGVWEYATTQFGAIVIYLKLCFWPVPARVGLWLDSSSRSCGNCALCCGCRAVGVGRNARLAILAVGRFSRSGVLCPAGSELELRTGGHADHG